MSSDNRYINTGASIVSLALLEFQTQDQRGLEERRPLNFTFEHIYMCQGMCQYFRKYADTHWELID